MNKDVIVVLVDNFGQVPLAMLVPNIETHANIETVHVEKDQRDQIGNGIREPSTEPVGVIVFLLTKTGQIWEQKILIWSPWRG